MKPPKQEIMTVVEQAWSQLPYFVKNQAVPPITLTEVEQLERELESYYYNLMKYSLENSCQLPTEFIAHLLQIDGRTSDGEKYGFSWHLPSTIFLNTMFGWKQHLEFTYMSLSLRECISPNQPIPPKAIWIEIAHWSDKHDIYLCCDTQSPYYGQVRDCHDNHPWWFLWEDEIEAESFLQYLRTWTI